MLRERVGSLFNNWILVAFSRHAVHRLRLEKLNKAEKTPDPLISPKAGRDLYKFPLKQSVVPIQSCNSIGFSHGWVVECRVDKVLE